jgi:TPR repeat protein
MDANTLYNRSLDYIGENGHPIDYEKAFSFNSQAAAKGLPDAILSMGWFYFNGFGTPQDLRSAERWYRRSARLGEPKAMFSLGEIAYDEKMFEVALQWFERAHKHGHIRSLYWLGKLHWRGQGVPQDRVKANKLFEQAARANDPEAKRLMRFRNRRRNLKRR